VAIYAATPQTSRDSWIRPYALEDVGRYEQELLDWMRSSRAEILKEISASGKFEEETEGKLVAALDEFAKIFQPSRAGGSAVEAA
jgi:F-type H+-transporting ATPase subunit alpha